MTRKLVQSHCFPVSSVLGLNVLGATTSAVDPSPEREYPEPDEPRRRFVFERQRRDRQKRQLLLRAAPGTTHTRSSPALRGTAQRAKA